MSIHESQVGPAPADRPDLATTAESDFIAVAETAQARGIRLRFRRWRRTRPFWGAVFVIFGAVEILLSMRAPINVIVHMGLMGLSGYIIPLVLLCTGLLLLFDPRQRTFYSIVAIVLALATWLTSNLGGFIIGMLCALIGGSLAFSWASRRLAAPPEPVPSREAGSPPDDPLTQGITEMPTTRIN